MEQFVVSARKYRPQTFKDVVGQQAITNTLLNAIETNHLASALLFTGPRGVGKTTCARCNGSGTESCEYCDGDGENSCQTCNETGTISDENDAIIQIRNYISWSVRWKNYFSSIKDNEELDYEDAKNFGFNNQTLLLNYEEEISKNYEGYENGNTFLDSFKDTKEINIIQTKQGLTIN
jgi:DNA polymerase III delta prime subunit